MTWKKYTLFILALILVAFACTNDLTQKKTDKKSYSSLKEEESLDKQQYSFDRLKDPATGEIPKGIRKGELNFAKKLPKKVTKSASDQWFQRGPNNLGGRTRAMGIDVNDENLIIAGGVTGGVFKSIDGGQNFYRVTPPDQLQSVSCIVQDTREFYNTVWYYGTGEGGYGVISHASYSNQTGGNGIYKSYDSGETWTLLESTVTNTPQAYADGTFDIVFNIVVNPFLTGDRVWAAVSKGIMYSPDGGTTWEEVLGFGSNNSEYTNIQIASDGIMYASLSAGTQTGIYRSVDGITWNDISPDNWPSAARKTSLAIDPCNSNQLYVFTNYSSNEAHRLYFMEYQPGVDIVTWDDRSEFIPNFDCQWWIDEIDYDIGSFRSQSSFCMDISVNPHNCNMVVLAGTNIYRSYDGFTSDEADWIGGYNCNPVDYFDTRYPNHHPDQHLMQFHPNNPFAMYNANDGGLYKTSDVFADDVEWDLLNTGYVTSQFYTVSIEEGATENPAIVGGTQDNGTWFNSDGFKNSDFTWIAGGDGSFCAIPEGAEVVYTSRQRGKVYINELDENNLTTNFKRIDPSDAPESSFLFIAPFALDVADNNIMYLPNGRNLFRCSDLSQFELDNSTDAVDTGWEKLDNATFPSGAGTNYISCLAQSIHNPNVLYYGTANGKTYRVENIHAPADQVSLVDITGPFGTRWISSMAVNPSDSEELLLTISNYNVPSIYYSNDGGETWTDIGGNLEENENGQGNGPSVIHSAIHSTGGVTTYYVGTSIGLYSTTNINDFETEWELEGAESLGYSVINMIKARSFDNTVYVATHGNGIFQNGEGEDPVSISELSDEEGLKLYPNPCRDYLNIDLPKLNETANLTITDISGKIVHQQKVPAAQKIELTTIIESLSNGAYIATLQTSNNNYSKQFRKW